MWKKAQRYSFNGLSCSQTLITTFAVEGIGAHLSSLIVMFYKQIFLVINKTNTKTELGLKTETEIKTELKPEIKTKIKTEIESKRNIEGKSEI